MAALTPATHLKAELSSPALQAPWIARLVSQPNIIIRRPAAAEGKADSEDALLGKSLKGGDCIQSYLYFYKQPPTAKEPLSEVSTIVTIGSGLNGHAHLLHGGMIATLIDEAMGIFKSTNDMREFERGEQPLVKGMVFTAELKVKYLAPVRTPTTLVITTRRVKKDGRKDWLANEVRQENEKGEIVLCATGESLFIEARPKI